MEKLSIEEKFNLLAEAEQFFADLGGAGEDVKQLGLRKAAALGTVRECLALYKKDYLKGEDWTEETLKEGLDTVIEEDYINDMIQIHGMTEEQAAFYQGGFGLAIGILEGNEEAIDGLRELQEGYAHLEEMKASDKTIADLLK